MAQPGPFAAVTTCEGVAASAAATAAPQPTAEWLATIKAAAEIDSVYMKVSAVFEAAPGDINAPAPITLDYYQPHLEALWKAFGSDRLIYGSNWPVCDRCGDPEMVYGEQLAVLRQFFGVKG
jgi:predicted TIM-barrel fold metal-dependent hydrolase